MLERDEANQMPPVHHRQRSTAGLLHAAKRGVEHLGVLGHLAGVRHDLPHGLVLATARKRAQEIGPGDHTQYRIALHHREVLLVRVPRHRDRARGRVLGVEDLKAGQHCGCDRHTGEHRARLHQ